ncbi:hypothetical protein CYMTET_48102 [Cymbomonas tetramitiformis]|uniref:Kinesin motor domain-containing protein n=1 Tax=Cymbomonas tetramitiformis TaxID=36881 RepID=A0AAE0BUN9_9CHLO|nr:hypothetical protein CYMTET_48102 [Cymbomonas tetramitiformis]
MAPGLKVTLQAMSPNKTKRSQPNEKIELEAIKYSDKTPNRAESGPLTPLNNNSMSVRKQTGSPFKHFSPYSHLQGQENTPPASDGTRGHTPSKGGNTPSKLSALSSAVLGAPLTSTSPAPCPPANENCETEDLNEVAPPLSTPKMRRAFSVPGRQRASRYPADKLESSVSWTSSDLRESISSTECQSVKVIIRIRPLNKRETNASAGSCVEACSNDSLKLSTQTFGQTFTFDNVADHNTDQESLFQAAGLPIVDNCLRGFNSCCFAYGQTGSGKTHTMLGKLPEAGMSLQSCKDRGVLPRVFEHLFDRLQQMKEVGAHDESESTRVVCKCSFLEIYNENLTDLLGSSSGPLHIREDARRGVYVENLQEYTVENVDDTLRLLQQGSANRQVGETKMNCESSRSHSVFTCTIESTHTKNGIATKRYSRLNLVDLAGSERQKSSGAAGKQLKEASSINKSLSALGLVMKSLVDVAQGRQRHVPYRDSRLTFLLQESLGGNAKTVMIAAVSPSSDCAAETLSTLKFAQRAKCIRNKAVINEDSVEDPTALKAEVQQLKAELKRQSLSYEHSLSLLKQAQLQPPTLEGGDHTPSTMLTGPDVDEEGSPPEFKQEAPKRKPFLTPQPVSFSSDSRVLMTPDATIANVTERALAGALRREKVAHDRSAVLEKEIESLKDVITQRETEAQSYKMLVKLRESAIERMEEAGRLREACSPERVGNDIESLNAEEEALRADQRSLEADNASLRAELQILRSQVHPDVAMHAAKAQELSRELEECGAFLEGGEKGMLVNEISDLREQLLCKLQVAQLLQEEEVKEAPEEVQEAPEMRVSACLARLSTEDFLLAKSQDAQALEVLEEEKQRLGKENTRLAFELASAKDAVERQRAVVQEVQAHADDQARLRVSAERAAAQADRMCRKCLEKIDFLKSKIKENASLVHNMPDHQQLSTDLSQYKQDLDGAQEALKQKEEELGRAREQEAAALHKVEELQAELSLAKQQVEQATESKHAAEALRDAMVRDAKEQAELAAQARAAVEAREVVALATAQAREGELLRSRELLRGKEQQLRKELQEVHVSCRTATAQLGSSQEELEVARKSASVLQERLSEQREASSKLIEELQHELRTSQTTLRGTAGSPSGSFVDHFLHLGASMESGVLQPGIVRPGEPPVPASGRGAEQGSPQLESPQDGGLPTVGEASPSVSEGADTALVKVLHGCPVETAQDPLTAMQVAAQSVEDGRYRDDTKQALSSSVSGVENLSPNTQIDVLKNTVEHLDQQLDLYKSKADVQRFGGFAEENCLKLSPSESVSKLDQGQRRTARAVATCHRSGGLPFSDSVQTPPWSQTPTASMGQPSTGRSRRSASASARSAKSFVKNRWRALTGSDSRQKAEARAKERAEALDRQLDQIKKDAGLGDLTG